MYKDVRAIAMVKLLIVLCFAQAAHFLYLGFEMTDFERAIHFDGCYLALVPKYTLNKIAFGASLMVGYFIYVLFLRPNYSLNVALRDVLICESDQWFDDSSRSKEVNVCKVVKRRFLIVLNMFQSLILLAGI